MPAGLQDVSAIIQLRATTKPWELKELSEEYIQKHIYEFYVAKVTWIIEWCVRIFHPSSYPYVLELGSIVSTYSWVGSELVTYVENYAQLVQRQVIAITYKNLEKTLEKHGWTKANEEFEKRKKESWDKNVWKKTPKRLDPDSLQSYL